MTMREFLRKHREEIDKDFELPRGRRNDHERELQVINNEFWYRKAAREGVKSCE